MTAGVGDIECFYVSVFMFMVLLLTVTVFWLLNKRITIIISEQVSCCKIFS